MRIGRSSYRRYREGDVAVEGYAEDYSFVIFGLLELVQAGGGWEWLTWARELQARQDALFWDDQHGGWFSTTGTDRSVLLRLKDEYDGAEPTASSIGVWNLMTLAHLDDASSLEGRIAETFRGSADRLSSHGRVVPMMSAALSGTLPDWARSSSSGRLTIRAWAGCSTSSRSAICHLRSCCRWIRVTRPAYRHSRRRSSTTGQRGRMCVGTSPVSNPSPHRTR